MAIPGGYPFAGGQPVSLAKNPFEPSPPRFGEPPSAPQRGPGRRGLWLGTAAVLVLAGAGAAVGVLVSSHSAGRRPTHPVVAPPVVARTTVTTTVAASTSSQTQLPSQPPSAPGAESELPPTESDIDLRRVSADPELIPVARLLDTYFSGINSHDAGRATSVFARDGSVDPYDLSQVERFGEGIRTTTDDHIRVISIRPAPAGLRVHVTFRSQQAASLGPAGESCTLWDLVYDIRSTARGILKLLHSEDVRYGAC